MSLPVRRQNLTRQTRFAFSCNRCLSCCRNKKIQVNPYEIARLASNRRMSTARFVQSCTGTGGTILSWKDDGTCVFLGPRGCEVHPDRPLVCRLYPLGRHLTRDGGEIFSEVEPDPGCRGGCEAEGSIGEYLEAQGAIRFIEAEDRYRELFMKLYMMACGEPEEWETPGEAARGLSGAGEEGGGILLDVDGTVEAWCRETGMPVPEGMEEKMAVHILAVEAWATKKTKRQP
jgi:uncharacterized protein